MYYHDPTPQAAEAEQVNEQRDDEMSEAKERLADIMTACGAPRSEAVKAAKGRVRHAE